MQAQCSMGVSAKRKECVEERYGQPAAKLFKKQVKSLTLRTGALVEASQLA